MQLDILRAIQSVSNPFLDIAMEAATLFGEELIVIAVFCFVYWCVDKQAGRFLGVSLGLSLCANGVAKDIFKVERPIGAEGIISQRTETATGYSFPSGHTQIATAFWGGIAVYVKRPVFKYIFAALVILIGFSRLYLGVHYPLDVLGGMILGLACTLGAYYALKARSANMIIAILSLIVIIAALIIGESDDTFKGAGALLGLLLGLYFEEKLVSFETDGLSIVKKLIRFLLGMVIVALCYLLPGRLLPHTNIVDFARYMLLTFAMAGIGPYVFKKLNI